MSKNSMCMSSVCTNVESIAQTARVRMSELVCEPVHNQSSVRLYTTEVAYEPTSVT